MNKIPLLTVITILCLAAFWRIFFLDLIEFKYDEAYTIFQMEQFYTHPYLMQVGPPQSTGAYNPPLFNYLMILLSIFSRHPQYVSFLIALVNVAFIGIFYFVIKRFYGIFTATLASLLIATSPWNILFSRKIWIPDLLFPFIVLFLYYFHLLVLEKKEKAIFPLFIILVLLPQMHASGGFFFLSILLTLVLLRMKVNIKKVFQGVAVGLIPALPYLWRQLTSTPVCIDCMSLLSYQGAPRGFDEQVFLRPVQFLGGFNFQAVLGADYGEFTQRLLPHTLTVETFTIFVFLILGSWVIIKTRARYLFLLLPIILMPTLYFLTKTPSYMHYFVILSPLVMLLVAISVTRLQTLVTFTWLRWVFCLAAALLIILNIIFVSSLYNFLSIKKLINGDFGPIYPLTDELVVKETQPYRLMPDYPLLKSYAYMFAQSKVFHQKLAEYFGQTQRPEAAIQEFNKALDINNQDIYSRANLAYLYKITGKKAQSQRELEILEQQDATSASQLKLILSNEKTLP